MRRFRGLVSLVVLSACGGGGWPLRTGETGWTGQHTFMFRDEPRTSDRFILTARGVGRDQRYGLVSGHQRRLLEPRYVTIEHALSPTRVYAREDPEGTFTRFVITDDGGGPRGARVEPTAYDAVWALPWEDDGFPVLPQASLRPRPRLHLGRSAPRAATRAWTCSTSRGAWSAPCAVRSATSAFTATRSWPSR